MKWTEPKVHDLSEIKKQVAQGDCATGGLYQPVCITGGTAGDCTNGVSVDNSTQQCVEGSAVT